MTHTAVVLKGPRRRYSPAQIAAAIDAGHATPAGLACAIGCSLRTAQRRLAEIRDARVDHARVDRRALPKPELLAHISRLTAAGKDANGDAGMPEDALMRTLAAQRTRIAEAA